MLIKDLLKQYKAFVFDFDGVVVDSLGIKADAFAQLFADLGPDVMSQVKAYHLSNGGVSRYEKFRYFYQTFRGREITAEESAALDRQYSDLVVRKVVEADFIPGVLDVLKAIKKSRKFCCVISATPEDEIRHIVRERGLEEFFQEVVGSPRSKKENLGRLLRQHGLSASETVYFGDAKSDYEAALEHGVDFVAVLGGGEQELAGLSGVVGIKDFIMCNAGGKDA